MDVGKAFSFPFQDEEWVTKLILAGVIMLIPVIGGIIVLGWCLAIARNVIKGEEQPLADWSDFGDLLTLGFKGFIISLIYALPIIVVSVPFGLVGSMVDSQDAEAILVIVSICFSCFSIIYGIALAFLLPAAFAELAATDDFSGALNPSRLFELVRAAPNAYVLTLLATLAAGFVAGLGVLLCFVGVIFTSAYAYAIYGNLYGQAYLEATAK